MFLRHCVLFEIAISEISIVIFIMSYSKIGDIFQIYTFIIKGFPILVNSKYLL